MDDARAVMDAAGIERATIMGVSEGGSLAVLFAASHPERCSALILYGAFARFSDWFPTKQKFDGFLNYVDTAWGTGTSIAAFAPSKKGDAEFQRWWSRFERLGGSPSAVTNLMRMNSEINIDNILPSILVPTLVLHRTEDPTVSIQAGRFLAAHIRHAKLVELDGPDHIYWLGDNALQIADLVVNFIAQPGPRRASRPDHAGCWRPFYSPISSTRRCGRVKWATRRGANCCRGMTRRFAGKWHAFAAAR
jgi:pimeloyl-ACP methyl ester carboxylesterase